MISMLNSVMRSMGHDPEVIQIRVDANTSYHGNRVSGEPDILLQISGRSFHRELFTRCRLMCIEVAFSQGDGVVMEKLRGYIHGIPELMVVGKIIIKEKNKCVGPTDARTINRFATRKVQDANRWFPSRNMRNDSGPVVKNGYTWIEIESIEVHIWVRLSKEPINLDVDPGSCRGLYGAGVIHLAMTNTSWNTLSLTFILQTLYPCLCMKDVDVVLAKGLEKIRDVAMYYSPELKGLGVTNTTTRGMKERKWIVMTTKTMKVKTLRVKVTEMMTTMTMTTVNRERIKKKKTIKVRKPIR